MLSARSRQYQNRINGPSLAYLSSFNICNKLIEKGVGFKLNFSIPEVQSAPMVINHKSPGESRAQRCYDPLPSGGRALDIQPESYAHSIRAGVGIDKTILCPRACAEMVVRYHVPRCCWVVESFAKFAVNELNVVC